MTTGNNLQNVSYYEPQYKGILSAVFNAQAAFAGAFAPIQNVDGISNNTKAFTVKTNVTPVVIGFYNDDPNIGMGEGTGKSSRFGKRTEVIYTDVEVDYSYNLAIHEGIDRNTVNGEFEQAIADRLELQSQAQVRYMNAKNGKFISDSASKTLKAKDLTEDSIKTLFNEANKTFVNNEVNNPEKTAYLSPDAYAAVMDMIQTNTLKGATINVDTNTISKYKGFKLVETAEQYFVTGEIAYFTADAVVIPFVGISTARAIDSEEFDGKALQAAAKGGQFILEDNKKAVLKAVLGASTGI